MMGWVVGLMAIEGDGLVVALGVRTMVAHLININY